MVSILPSISNESPSIAVDSSKSNSLFKIKHSELFCDKIPVKIFFDEHSGIHFVSVESLATNLTNVSISYVTYPFPDGIPNATAHLALSGTNTDLSADRFEHYLGKVFSSSTISIDVQSDYTAFLFDLVGGTSGYIQLLNSLLENLSIVSFGERDFKHQIWDAEESWGKLDDQLRIHGSQLQVVVDKARRARSFCGLTHENDHIGTSEDLRENCTLSKVVHYFRSFYRSPWIMLSEKLSTELDLTLLDTLSMKQSYALKHTRRSLEVENYANLIASQGVNDIRFHYSDVVTVSGACTSNNKGIVQIGFLAEPPTNATFIEAIAILADYLCGSKTSQLNATLASGKNAVCSSVDIQLKIGPRCEVVVQLNDVPKPFLNKGVVEKFFDALSTIKWELQRLKESITRRVKYYEELIECNYSTVVFERLRLFQVYADSHDLTLLRRLLNPTHILGEILQLSAVYWQSFATNLFIENCSVVVGVPNNDAIYNMLLNNQSMALNPNGNKKQRRSMEYLKKIFKSDDLMFSQEIVGVVSASVYPFHKLFPFTLKAFHWNIVGSKLNLLPKWFKHLKAMIDPSTPLTVTVHSIDSNFVRAVFVLNLKGVELRLRYYILLFVKLLFVSASFVNGEFMSATEINNLLRNEVTEYGCELGFDGDDMHLMRLVLKVPTNKLELIEKWFHAVLCNVVFDANDVLEAIISLLDAAKEGRKSGVLFCTILLNSMTLSADDEDFFASPIVLETFHNNLLEAFLNGSHQNVVKDLQSLRDQLLGSNIGLHLIGDAAKLSSSHALVFDDLKRFRVNDQLGKITIEPKTQKSYHWPSKPEIHVIAANRIQSVSDMIERLEFQCQPLDDHHAAVLIFCNYFSHKSGIFCRCIIEDGQAQSATLSYNVNKQAVTLAITGAKNLKSTRQLISFLLRQMFIESMDSELFKVAQRSVAATLVVSYSNVQSAGSKSIRDNIYNWTVDQITSFVHKVLVISEARCKLFLYDLIVKLASGKNLKAILCPDFQMTGVLQKFYDILQPNSLVQHKNDKQFELLLS